MLSIVETERSPIAAEKALSNRPHVVLIFDRARNSNPQHMRFDIGRFYERRGPNDEDRGRLLRVRESTQLAPGHEVLGFCS